MAESPAWSLERGARILGDGSVRFSVWAPRAERVDVRLVGGPELAMEHGDGDVFLATLRGVEPGTDYFYRLDGERDRPDPVSRFQPRGVHGPSRVVDPATFRWSDSAWTGVEMADLVIYELHVGTFTGAGSFEAAIERLASLGEL